MKILISTSYYLPNVSGITIYIKNLSEELVKRGYEVKILTSKHLPNLKNEEKNNGVFVKRIWAPIKIGKGLIMPFFLFTAIKEIIKSDVINCHLPSLESFFIAFGKIVFKKKLIVTYHCDFDSGNKLINKLINAIQSLALKSADKIVVNTNDYIENYNLLKNYQNKIIEIYPPIIIEKINNNEQLEIDQKLEKFKNKKIIGFLGRVSKEKNLELLIKAIPLIRNKKFVIVIAGPNKVIGENVYQKKIDALLNKNKNIILRLGEIKNVSAFLKKCDCLVTPSNNRLESFAMVQVEAIKNGIPCVVSNLPGTRIPVLKSGFGELFENNNEIDLAKKLEKVLENGKKYYQNKFNKNLKMFDCKKSVDEYEKLFLERI